MYVPALIVADFVDTGGVVLAEVAVAVVHVLLAPHTGEPTRTLAPSGKTQQIISHLFLFLTYSKI